MKQLLITLVLLLSGFYIQAQQEKPFFDLLVGQNYERAGEFFDNRIDLCIDKFQGMVSRTEAVKMISEYLSSKNPQSYTIRHKGDSKGMQSSYFVGTINTKEGPVRVFVYFGKNGSKSSISELRLESD